MPTESLDQAQRVPRSVPDRLLEIQDDLAVLKGRLQLREHDDPGHGACHLAGTIAWRVLVVREMVLALPGQAHSAAERTDALRGAGRDALALVHLGHCHDLHEALLDLQTVLADVEDIAADHTTDDSAPPS
jgi:hypothetical protein